MRQLLDVLQYLLIWTIIGAFAFNIYVLVVFRTGLVYTAREQDGTLRRQGSLSGFLNSMLLLLMIVGLLLLSNGYLFRTGSTSHNFLGLLALNYGLYLLLFLYDTCVIDYYVIGRWRPAVLQIPDEMTAESMGVHIRASLAAGPVIGLVLASLSAGMAMLFFTG